MCSRERVDLKSVALSNRTVSCPYFVIVELILSRRDFTVLGSVLLRSFWFSSVGLKLGGWAPLEGHRATAGGGKDDGGKIWSETKLNEYNLSRENKQTRFC